MTTEQFLQFSKYCGINNAWATGIKYYHKSSKKLKWGQNSKKNKWVDGIWYSKKEILINRHKDSFEVIAGNCKSINTENIIWESFVIDGDDHYNNGISIVTKKQRDEAIDYIIKIINIENIAYIETSKFNSGFHIYINVNFVSTEDLKIFQEHLRTKLYNSIDIKTTIIRMPLSYEYEEHNIYSLQKCKNNILDWKIIKPLLNIKPTENPYTNNTFKIPMYRKRNNNSNKKTIYQYDFSYGAGERYKKWISICFYCIKNNKDFNTCKNLVYKNNHGSKDMNLWDNNKINNELLKQWLWCKNNFNLEHFFTCNDNLNINNDFISNKKHLLELNKQQKYLIGKFKNITKNLLTYKKNSKRDNIAQIILPEIIDEMIGKIIYDINNPKKRSFYIKQTWFNYINKGFQFDITWKKHFTQFLQQKYNIKKGTLNINKIINFIIKNTIFIEYEINGQNLNYKFNSSYSFSKNYLLKHNINSSPIHNLFNNISIYINNIINIINNFLFIKYNNILYMLKVFFGENIKWWTGLGKYKASPY